MATADTASSSTTDGTEMNDEEKAFLADEQHACGSENPPGLSPKFWLSAGINTVSTAAIVRI